MPPAVFVTSEEPHEVTSSDHRNKYRLASSPSKREIMLAVRTINIYDPRLKGVEYNQIMY